jgi:hypothetical protein
LDTEAGAHGFDQDYFVQQVAGLSQLAGELMRVQPLVVDLGWGTLRSALVDLADSAFATPPEAATRRRTLLDQYVAAFRHIEAAALKEARSALDDLAANAAIWLVPDRQHALAALLDGQLAKLV